MLINILVIMLINKDDYHKFFGNEKPEPGVMVKILNTCRVITADVLWQQFFDRPEDNLYCHTALGNSLDKAAPNIKLFVGLETDYYNKYFGKLIPEEKEKEIERFILKVTKELDKIDWRKII